MIIFIIIITLLSLVTDKNHHLVPISHPDSFINSICISMQFSVFIHIEHLARRSMSFVKIETIDSCIKIYKLREKTQNWHIYCSR